MEKVVDLTTQCKIKENQNGRKNLLVEEVIVLEVAIFVTLGIIMVKEEKKDLGLMVLVIKQDIELFNVLNLGRRFEVIAEALWLVRKLLKRLMNLKMVRT